MTAHARLRMTVDEYLAWAQEHPGHYELFGGEVFAMAPETARHAEIKANVQHGLRTGRRKNGLRCFALPNGMTVRIHERTAYEPDALVYCGEKMQPTAMDIPCPVIIVDVLSQSTRRIDVSRKLVDYFRLPSVSHYLIFETDRTLAIHHARGQGDTILTRSVTEGSITLDPPGLELALSDIYEQDAA